MRITAVLLLTVAVGCATDESADDAVGGAGGGKADGAGTAAQLAPTYALELTSKMKTEDRRESDPAKRFSELSMRARAQVKVTQTADGVSLAVKICDVRLPIVNGYQPELDAAFVASLPALQITGAIDGTDLVTEPAALVLGATLAHPLTDALPAATSSHVTDQDRDGNAGVSIAIPGYGSIFASLRVKLAFSAPATNPATLAGAADVTLDQKIYGDSIWFYDAAASAAEAEGNVSVVSSSNRVTMKKDASSCAKVVSLFP